MIGNLARKRTNVVAVAALLALVAAMFAALAPAQAHILGTCSDPEYLTQAKCEETWDHDNDSSTDPVARGTWTTNPHNAANHPPTLSITVLDSDGVVPDDSTVSVYISVANVHISNVADTDGDGDVDSDDGPTPETTLNSAVTLEYVRVSGELEGPSSASPITFTQTANGDDDNSAGFSIQTIVIPAGTAPGKYTVSARLSLRTGNEAYYDYSGNDFTTKSARATFTVGDAGLGLSSAALSLGNRVNDLPETLTDETKVETGSDSATSDGINLVVTASNSLGNKSNNGDVSQITVIAPGGSITVNSPRKDAATARPQTKTPIITSSLAAQDNSFSISESTVTKAAATDDAIQQTMSINVNKANDEPGTVDVYVILAGKGAAITNTITLTFTGPNAGIAIGDPSDSLLAFTEVTTLPEVLRRDITSFALSASDAGGNPGSVPSVRTRILDVDGKVVNQEKIKVEQGPNSSGIPNTKLTLTSLNSSLTPLKAGAYSIRISTSGGLSASGTFEVVGQADSVDLSVDTTAPSTVGEVVTATATVTAGGQPVPNGTVVTFKASDVSGDADSVLVAVGGGVQDNGDSEQRAFGGVASASFVAVGHGKSVISATAHRTTDVEVINSTAGEPAPVETEPEAVTLDCLSTLNGFSAYTCDVQSSASELFTMLAGRATAIHLNNGATWVRYSIVDGAEVPGSSDFAVTTNDILYISN